MQTLQVPRHALGVVPDREVFASLAVGWSRCADIVRTLGEPHYPIDTCMHPSKNSDEAIDR